MILIRNVHEFSLYDFTTGMERGYSTKKLALVNHLKVKGSPVLPVLSFAVDDNWLSNVARNKIADVQRDNGHYYGVVDDDGSFQVMSRPIFL